jgi:hypothetical protein
MYNALLVITNSSAVMQLSSGVGSTLVWENSNEKLKSEGPERDSYFVFSRVSLTDAVTKYRCLKMERQLD